jgi:hypothetical protein
MELGCLVECKHIADDLIARNARAMHNARVTRVTQQDQERMLIADPVDVSGELDEIRRNLPIAGSRSLQLAHDQFPSPLPLPRRCTMTSGITRPVRPVVGHPHSSATSASISSRRGSAFESTLKLR